MELNPSVNSRGGPEPGQLDFGRVNDEMLQMCGDQGIAFVPFFALAAPAGRLEASRRPLSRPRPPERLVKIRVARRIFRVSEANADVAARRHELRARDDQAAVTAAGAAEKSWMSCPHGEGSGCRLGSAE